MKTIATLALTAIALLGAAMPAYAGPSCPDQPGVCPPPPGNDSPDTGNLLALGVALWAPTAA